MPDHDREDDVHDGSNIPPMWLVKNATMKNAEEETDEGELERRVVGQLDKMGTYIKRDYDEGPR